MSTSWQRGARAGANNWVAGSPLLENEGSGVFAAARFELHAAGIDIALAEVRLPVLTMARRSGLLDALGEDRVFHTIQEAVGALQSQKE